MNGLARISHSQIASWSALTGNVVRDHEVQILLAMDRARREASTPEAIEDRAEPPPPHMSLGQQMRLMWPDNRSKRSSMPMTPQVFDALFP
jgi:hypothetical protein